MPEVSGETTVNMADELAELLTSDPAALNLLQSLKCYSSCDKIRWQSAEKFEGSSYPNSWKLFFALTTSETLLSHSLMKIKPSDSFMRLQEEFCVAQECLFLAAAIHLPLYQRTFCRRSAASGGESMCYRVHIP